MDLLNYINICLKELGEGIRKVGEGHLDVHLDKIKDDEFGKTFDEFDKFVINLKSVIENIMKDMTLTPVLHQLDQKIIYPHYDFKHLTEKYFEIGMKLDDFLIQLVKY